MGRQNFHEKTECHLFFTIDTIIIYTNYYVIKLKI